MTAEQMGRRFGWLIRMRMRPLNGHAQLREQMRKDLFDIFDQVREAALNWDGSDPIRVNWPQG